MTLRSRLAGMVALLPLLGGCVDAPSRHGDAASGELGARVADAMLRSGNPAAALQVADGLLAANPRDAEAHARRGRALLAMDRPGEAAEDLAEAARLQPNDVSILAALAAAREAGGDSAAAEASWRVVLARSPVDRQARIGLAVSLDLQERHGEAQTLYRAVLRDRPDDVAAATDLGLSLALSGQTREALSLLERPGVTAQGPRARHDLAVAMVLAGDEVGARAVLAEDLSEAQVSAAIEALRELGRG
jgi:Flp pilus assembly protein TadD